MSRGRSISSAIDANQDPVTGARTFLSSAIIDITSTPASFTIMTGHQRGNFASLYIYRTVFAIEKRTFIRTHFQPLLRNNC